MTRRPRSVSLASGFSKSNRLTGYILRLFDRRARVFVQFATGEKLVVLVVLCEDAAATSAAMYWIDGMSRSYRDEPIQFDRTCASSKRPRRRLLSVYAMLFDFPCFVTPSVLTVYLGARVFLV